jgi:hypothetical protein
MLLNDAIRRSQNWTAKLIIKDPADPHGYGRRDLGGAGTLYMWTMGHSNPIVICGYTTDMPKPDQTLKCICGKSHNFPAGKGRLLFDVAHDDRWEPCFPMDVLDVLARDPLPPMTDKK